MCVFVFILMFKFKFRGHLMKKSKQLLVFIVVILVQKNVHEFFTGHCAFPVYPVCFKHHFFEFIIAHILTKLASNHLEVLECYVVFVLAEQDESLGKLLFTVSLRHLSSHNVQEIIEVYSHLPLFISRVSVFISMSYVIILVAY